MANYEENLYPSEQYSIVTTSLRQEIERLQGELDKARETNRNLNRRAIKAEAIICANPSTGAYFQKLGDLFARTLLATIDAERAARKQVEGELSAALKRVDQAELIINEEYSDLGYRPGHGMRTYKELAGELSEARSEIERLKEENAGLMDGFNAEGESAREACCGAYKAQLRAELVSMEREALTARNLLSLSRSMCEEYKAQVKTLTDKLTETK